MEKNNEEKVKPESYFQDRVKSIDKICEGKTKDVQIKWLKNELADSQNVTRMCLDYWGKTLDKWKYWNNIGIALMFVAFLLGMAWGIMLFA